MLGVIERNLTGDAFVTL